MFQDDFSDTASGWERATDDRGAIDYQDGGYHILVDSAALSIWANPGCDFTDVSVEVDGHKIGGVDDNEFGLICRYQDVDNFYAGVVTSDGYYAFWHMNAGNFEFIGMDGFAPSDAISLGAGVNRVRLDCVRSTLTLYANGTQLGVATDSSLSSGDVGLYAGTFETAGVDILFDNFIVYLR